DRDGSIESPRGGCAPGGPPPAGRPDAARIGRARPYRGTRPPPGDGVCRAGRGDVATAQGVPEMPLGLLRPLQESFRAVVRDGYLREPGEGSGLPVASPPPATLIELVRGATLSPRRASSRARRAAVTRASRPPSAP